MKFVKYALLGIILVGSVWYTMDYYSRPNFTTKTVPKERLADDTFNILAENDTNDQIEGPPSLIVSYNGKPVSIAKLGYRWKKAIACGIGPVQTLTSETPTTITSGKTHLKLDFPHDVKDEILSVTIKKLGKTDQDEQSSKSLNLKNPIIELPIETGEYDYSLVVVWKEDSKGYGEYAFKVRIQ